MMRREGYVWLLVILLLTVGCSSDNGNDGDIDGGIDGDTTFVVGLVGDPCTTNEDCTITAPGGGSVACLRASWGFREGYCAVLGLDDEGQCQSADSQSTHVDLPCSESVCMKRCEGPEDCRAGYECFSGIRGCWPRCQEGRACPSPPPRLCSLDEECDDGDACTMERCVDDICAYERITDEHQRVVRIATLGEALDVDFFGSIAGDNLTLAVAEGDDGVEVFDLSNPQDPQIFHRIDTVGTALAVYRQANRLLVAEGDDGVEIFDANSPALLSQVLLDEGEGSVMGFGEMTESVAYVYGYRHGMQRLDIGTFGFFDPDTACDTRGRAVHGVLANPYILISDSLAGLSIFQWTSIKGVGTVCEEVDRMDTDGRMVAVSLQGDVLAAAEAGAGFGLFDVSDVARPNRVHTSIPFDGDVVDVRLTGSKTLAVAASESGVFTYMLEDCFEPVPWNEWETDGPALSIDYADGVLAIALGEDGLDLVDMGCRAVQD